jgi:GLPGLI family protein
MKSLILLTLCTLLFVTARAQSPRFLPAVKIEFEKVVYVHQLYKQLEPEWYERIKDRLPQVSTTYFDFMGDSSRSLYKPGREAPRDPRMFYQGMADKNVVYNDYSSGNTVIQKPVFEETFLVQDSLLKVRWKLTSDTRTIAGFDCRKAVGFIDDTIAVFAFYTEEILISGGPESVNGLPGMILGLGMPRIHTTWFATKVEVNGINMTQVIPATKGKKVNRKSMITSLDKVLKEWGDYGKNMIWNFVI